MAPTTAKEWIVAADLKSYRLAHSKVDTVIQQAKTLGLEERGTIGFLKAKASIASTQGYRFS